MVEKKTCPPGFARRAHAATVLAGSGTCSSSSMHVTTSNCPAREPARDPAGTGPVPQPPQALPDVELPGGRAGERLRGFQFVLHREAPLEQMQLRHLERFLGQIAAGHAGAEAGPR